MRRILALVLAIGLWISCVPTAFAAEPNVAGLVPCSESSAFQFRAQNARNTTDDPLSGQKRFERYSEALCGPEGLPRLIVDGRWSHAGDFIIPSILFLYIAGWIGWVGRAYIIAVRDSGNAEDKEIIIDVPLAVGKMLGGFIWPLAAVKEALSGELYAKDNEIPISPR